MEGVISMFNLIVLAASLMGGPIEPLEKPAYFEITVESRTPYTLYINGEQIEANTCYKTEPLSEAMCVEVEIRYVSGGEVVKKKMFMDLDPGYKRCLTLTISARPALAWC
jgi:hypothetical protein